MRAWVFQDYRQKKKLGEEKCPWSVGWYNAEGQKRSKRIGCKSLANRYAKKLENEAIQELFNPGYKRRRWKDVAAEWKKWAAGRMRVGTIRDGANSLEHFCRIMSNMFVDEVTTAEIDRFVQRRSEEDGRHGEKVSTSTVNKDLRHIKAMLRLAEDWGYMKTQPKIRLLREEIRMPRYMTPEDFTTIYNACEKFATKPALPYCTPGEWWRAMLAFAYMTGWRISEILSLKKEDVDLKIQTAITRAVDNKCRRDELMPLHSSLIPQLERVFGGDKLVFEWPHNDKTLWTEFIKLQKNAGIVLTCDKKHRHGVGCHAYGFHDMRRAFATNNAENLSASALQTLMRHRAYETTQKYINMAQAVNRAADKLHCPDVLVSGIVCSRSVDAGEKSQTA